MPQHTSAKTGHQTMGSDMTHAGAPTASDSLHEVAGQVKDSAGHVATRAREQVSSRLAGQKDRAAEGLNSVAHALRQSGQQLRDQDQQNITAYFNQAAAQIDRFSSYLQQRDLGQLIDDGERFARRQPAMFLGSAFVLGLLGARFLKSSRPYSAPTNGYAASAAMADQRRGYYSSYSSAYPHESVSVPDYDTATPADRSAFGQPPAREGTPYGDPN